MTSLADRYFPLRTFLPAWATLPLFPAETLDYPDDSLLVRLYFTTLTTPASEAEASLDLGVVWESAAEMVFTLLGIAGLSVVVGAGNATELVLAATFSETGF